MLEEVHAIDEGQRDGVTAEGGHGVGPEEELVARGPCERDGAVQLVLDREGRVDADRRGARQGEAASAAYADLEVGRRPKGGVEASEEVEVVHREQVNHGAGAASRPLS